MPIEFSCNNCNKLLRVPDGTAGKPCQCPACGALSTVPGFKAPASESTRETQLDDGLTLVTCPKCQYPLRCKTELMGSKGQCKQCKHIFVIGEKSSSSIAATALVFSCPKCNQLFDGKPEMEGRNGKCHSCGDVFPIKLRQAESESKPKIDKSAAPSMASTQAKPKASQPKPAPSPPPPSAATPSSKSNIQLICGSCRGAIEVPSSAAGMNVACPHCQQLLKIPDTKNSPATPKPTRLDPPPPSHSSIFDGLDVPTTGSGFPAYAPQSSTGAYPSYSSPSSYEPSAYSPYAQSEASSNYANPYQSPYQSTELDRAMYSEGGGDRQWLRSVASWHRRLCVNLALCILTWFIIAPLSFFFGTGSEAFSSPGTWVAFIFMVIGLLVLMAASVLYQVSFIVLCFKVHEGSEAAFYVVGYFIGACLPLVSLILLSKTMSKASKILRSNGIEVGFLGTDPSRI